MKIVSYNVNGIRAAIKKGFVDWVAENEFDIICVQETKAMREQVPLEEMEALGYSSVWHSAVKKGYSGVATFSKKKPSKVIEGFGYERYDNEGRVIRTDFGALTVLNCYFPSGTTGTIRQDVKFDFLRDFMIYMEELKKTCKKIIVVGDYNIAHTEIDIHNPKTNKNSSGFLPEERAWMTTWLSSGFTDAYRSLHPEKIEYSWWSYRAGARGNNKGWRIDYQSVTDNIVEKIKDCYHMKDAVHSDHCPVYLEVEI